MIATGSDSDQPMDLSIGSRSNSTAIQKNKFCTPVIITSPRKLLSPILPPPPTKRTYDEMQYSEAFYTPNVNPAASAALKLESSSSSAFKKSRMHSPERRKFFLDFDQPGQSNTFCDGAGVSQKVEVGEYSVPGSIKFNSALLKDGLPNISIKEQQPNKLIDQTEYEKKHEFDGCFREAVSIGTNRRALSQSPDNLIDALRVKSNFHNSSHLEECASFQQQNFSNLNRWSNLDPATPVPSASSSDTLYSAYMYLNYLPYLLLEKSEAERRRLDEMREMSSPFHKSFSPSEGPNAFSELYSAYLTSILTTSYQSTHSGPSHPASPVTTETTSETATSSFSTYSQSNPRPSFLTPDVTPLSTSFPCTSRLKYGRKKSVALECDSVPFSASSASLSRMCSVPASVTSSHHLQNDDFSSGSTRKPFVRASSFDDNLVRARSEYEKNRISLQQNLRHDHRIVDPMGYLRYYSKMPDQELVRANSSMPNLPSCSRQADQNPVESTLQSVSDFIGKFSQNALPSGLKDNDLDEYHKRNINMINIQNFTNVKDLYSINDVNKLILGNIKGNFSHPNRRNRETSKSPKCGQEDNADLERKSPTSTKLNSNGLNPNAISGSIEPSSSSELCARKKPSRALTGRHVRSGTGASISTLASLREKIKERRNQIPQSTPTSSRVAGRGRGRRRQLHV